MSKQKNYEKGIGMKTTMKKRPVSTFGSILILMFVLTVHAAEIHIRTDGPIRTLVEAQTEARKNQATVVVHAGTYYLPETLVFTAADSGTTYVAAPGEKPVLSGGMKLDLQWSPYKDRILQAKTPAGMTIDQFFVNGKCQIMARYPNYNPKALEFNGVAADAFSKERAARWADPVGGYMHVMHPVLWGSFDYRITGKNDKGELTYEGGWQHNRPSREMNPTLRFVENIFEELDAPGEWFHHAKTGTLYYYPPADVDVKTALVEGVRLRHLVEFHGAKNITLRGLIFRHAARTFMEKYEPLLRSDWTIYRGGAVLFNHAEDCNLADCEFDQLGGNAIFVNGYNRRIRIAGCDIHDTGASAVAFVGETNSVRNPFFINQDHHDDYASIDKTPGPKTDDYPADCIVEDCLIRHIGAVEKQAAGVALDMAMHITVRHCSIYDASRAAINIGEGAFGGHVIEFCDIFDAVKETSDHGCFNSWGRDRYWHLKGAPANELPKLAMLDVVKPNIIRNSRWRCDDGWELSLDDGASNYEIYNNLFLNGGLKLREGFNRRVWNNIAVNNSLHPHAWFENSGDIVTNNIWMGAYRPAGSMTKGKWGREVDGNLFTTTDADRTKFAAKGCDEHSLVGDAMFVDPAKGDYRVKDGSPALKLGFKNFPMDQFGVMKPELKAIARTPVFPVLGAASVSRSKKSKTAPLETKWLGATVRNIEGAEYSAFGVTEESGGVHLKNVPAVSCLARAGLRTDDLIQGVNGKAVRTVEELFRAAQGEPLKLQFVREQETKEVTVTDYVFVAAESSSGVNFKAVPSLIRTIATRPDPKNEPTTALFDGKLASNHGPIFGNGVRNGCYRADLGKVTVISEIRSWSFNMGGIRGAQHFSLLGSDSEADPGWDMSKFQPIAEVSAAAKDKYLVTAVRRTGGKPLGSYRWLIWMTQPVTKRGENTPFQEFQVE